MPGAPLLLLPGSASSSAQWRSLAAVLAGRLRVHAPDLGRYGANPLVPSGARPFTLAAWSDARLAVLAGAGHMGPVTHRPAFQAVVEEHLAAVDCA